MTKKQIAQLKALMVFGAYFLAKDSDGFVWGFKDKPEKGEAYWGENIDAGYLYICLDNALTNLVLWSDEEPLNIAQCLRDNGVEVEAC